MKSKKCLIITYYFPPMNMIASKRFGGMIRYFKACNWEAFIVTTNSTGDLEVDIDEKHIYRFGKIDQRTKGYSGFSAKGKIYSSMARVLLFGMTAHMKTIGRELITWYPYVMANMDMIIREVKPDVVISSYGPFTAYLIAYKIAKKYKIPWVADYRDLCSLYKQRKPAILNYLDRRIEYMICSRADNITAASNYLAGQLKLFLKKPIHVIYNAYDNFERQTPVVQGHKKKERLLLYYAGCFYEHQLESVGILFEAIGKMQKNGQNVHLKIRSLGPRKYEKEIKSMIRNYRIESMVELLPATSRVEVSKEESLADYLVIFEDICKDKLLTGKLFEYLPYKVPIMAVCWPDSEIASVLSKTERGCVCSSSDEIIKMVNMDGEMFAGNENVKLFSRREQAKKMCQIMDKLVDKPYDL